MFDNLKPYPAYKDSGLLWLGEVPEHWNVLPGRACYKEKKISNAGLKERTVLSLSYGQIVIKPEDKLHGLVPSSFETYQIVEPKDIVIRPTDLQNDWVSLRFGLSGHRGIITSAYMCFNTQPVMCSEYGHLLLHTYDLKKVFYGLGSGLRQNLDWCDFKYLPYFVPPLPEQTAIVRYLDYMERRIRHYINAKKKLIVLLNEQKQAIIHRAVTRGLDSNVRIKPSGVEWLGDIPEHWEVRRLKYVCRFEYGDSLPDNMRVQGDIAVYGSNGKIGTHDRGNTNAPCIVIGRKGSFGKVNFSSESVFAIDTTFFVDERYTDADLSWLYYILTWARLDSVSKDSAVPGLDRGEAYTQQITYCSRDEQAKIAEWLDQQLASVDRAILKINEEIDLLRKYRTRLIADVVTGKLDVREAAANLPEEAEEELFEEADLLSVNETAVEDDEGALTGVKDEE